MTKEIWATVLKASSGMDLNYSDKNASYYDKNTTYIDDSKKVLPDVGDPPMVKFPEKTRLAFLKRIILRVMRVYTRGLDEVHRWFRNELNANRHSINSLMASVEYIDKSIEERISSQLKNIEEPLQESIVRIDKSIEERISSQLKNILPNITESQLNLETRIISIENHYESLKKAGLLDESSFQKISDKAFIKGLESTLSHNGLLAEAGLWFNPPVVLKLESGHISVDQIHERIIENGLIMAELYLHCKPGASILDIGSAESLLPMQFASMGYKVTCIDLRPYPLRHRNLTIIQGDFFNVTLARNQFDFISCVSSIEHFGLDWYGNTNFNGNIAPDILAVQRISDALKPGGWLFLSLPYADEYQVDTLERTYDANSISNLIQQPDLVEISRRVFCREGKTEWIEKLGVEPVNNRRAIIVLLLRKDDSH